MIAPDKALLARAVPKAMIVQNIRTLQKRLRSSPTGMPVPGLHPHNS